MGRFAEILSYPFLSYGPGLHVCSQRCNILLQIDFIFSEPEDLILVVLFTTAAINKILAYPFLSYGPVWPSCLFDSGSRDV